ncbi:nuclear transport factor 2 family protein [Bosea sp. NPDC055332]
MYHRIVQARVRALFDAVNRGDAEPVIAAFAQTFEHRFLGDDHALGGSRTSLAGVRDWYGRLYRLLPDIRFDLERIDVAGPPWNTVVIVDWRETNSGTDGVRTFNRGHHVLYLAWGRATRLLICPDTTLLAATLDRLFAAGNLEAHAPPITG